MNIFEFAMDKEKYAEHYYRELAGKANHTGLTSILTMLADEEVKHYETVESMKAQNPQAAGETPVLANAKEIFEKMRGSAEKFDFDASEVDVYRKARDIEKESRAFYLEKAGEVQDADQKKIFQRLAEEENKHLVLVQSICDFVSRPETYLEDAEFNHFDDYVEGQF
jgi:rubrerythrin